MSDADFPIATEKGKKYRLEEREGKSVRVYESGAVLDAKTLKIADQPIGKAITAQTASSLAHRRWEKAREEFEAGAIEAVDGNSPAAAQRVLGKALMRRAINPDSGAGVQAAERIAEFSGWIGKDKAPETTPPGTISLSLAMTAKVEDLRGLMLRHYEQQESAQNVVEGEFKKE